MLSNKWYDILKWVAQLVLPAGATFYYGLSSIWGFPYQTEIVGSIIAVNVWLSALLVVSNAQYQGMKEPTIKIPGAPFGMDARAYQSMKWVTLAFLPASGALYFTLAGLWGFPYGEQVAATIAAVTTFAGVVLGVSKVRADKLQQ